MGDLKGTFTITKEGGKYTGTIADESGQTTTLNNLMIEDGKLSTNYSAGGYDIDMKGDFDNTTFSGTINVAGFDLNVSAILLH